MRPNERIKVLIAHGDPLIAAGLAATLGRMRDFESVGGGASPAKMQTTVSAVPGETRCEQPHAGGFDRSAPRNPA